MPHQDQSLPTATAPHHQDLKQAIEWILADADLDHVGFRHTCHWTPKAFIATVLLWAWGAAQDTLTQRFRWARQIAVMAWGLNAATATSYQAFLKLLHAWTVVLAAAVVAALRRHMQEDLDDRFFIAGYAVFGVDGTRLQLPRTASNQKRFAATAKASAKSRRRRQRREAAGNPTPTKTAECPQMWLTTLWHVGTGLPWDWRTGPTDSSEREHLVQMIETLPAEALVTADAGFAGYGCWKALLQGNQQWLIRVGANVHLLRRLGYTRESQGIVYLWPNREMARREPPLVLRLVVAHTGRHPMYLVTSVLDEKRLPATQVVAIYRLRWGVELFYRHFKQTYGRRKLRSHRSANAELEVTWSLLGLWALCLHGQVELSFDAVPASRVSVAGLLRAYRSAMQEYRSVPEPGESLKEQLCRAVIDSYPRSNKASREYPQKKRTHAIGAPKIRAATEVEVEIAQQIKDAHSKRLTA